MKLCPLYSGSSGNSTLVEAGGVRLLVDAGLPGRTVEQALRSVRVEPSSVNAILVTHEHSDHVQGVGVLARRYGIPVYANAGTWEGMTPLTGEISPRSQRVFETGRDFYVKDVNVYPFKTPHDANESVGYVFEYKGLRLGLMTDVGHVSPELLGELSGLSLLLLEANHDEEMLMAGSYPYPLKRRILGDNGHLSNLNAGRALGMLYRGGLRRAVLGHLSRENNYESLAMQTVRVALAEQDIAEGEFHLCVAHRDRTCGVFEV